MKCIEDEIPFELPDGWSWCHYSDVIELYSGQDLTPDRYNDVGNGIPYIIGASNLEHGKVIINRWTTTPTTHATIGDLLLTVKGSGVGKMAFCDIADAHIARQIMALRCTNAITPQYLYIAISAMLSDITAQANGIIPGIRREIVLGTLLPLPPFHEQERICERADSSLLIIDTIDRDEDDLRDYIQNIKSKILDLAIRGQLVPQDAADEPASVLLERIRVEKEELIRQGKIKRDKKESIIFRGEDNSYYEKYGEKLPSGWVVTNFETLLEYEQPTKYIVSDTNYKPTYKTPVLTAGKSFILGYTNETDNIFDDLPVIIFDDFTTESKFVDFKFKVKSSAMKILHINQDLVLPKYAFYLMQATDIDHDNHQRYWISTYSQEIVALPPINEQERILTTLEHYNNLLDTLQ